MLNNTTGQDIPKEGSENVWKNVTENSLSQYKNLLGKNYADNPAYQAILALYNQAIEQEKRFNGQAKELEIIKKDSKETIDSLKIGAKEFKEKIKEELGIWKIIIGAITVVTAIGFITLIVDTFWSRNDDFHKMNLEYNDRVNNLENKINIMESEKEGLEKKIDGQQIIIENFKKQQNCLEGKNYWQYEQCFR